MTKQEIIERMQAATKSIKSQGLLKEEHSFDSYWSNSASQSYCDAVKTGNVKVVAV